MFSLFVSQKILPSGSLAFGGREAIEKIEGTRQRFFSVTRGRGYDFQRQAKFFIDAFFAGFFFLFSSFFCW